METEHSGPNWGNLVFLLQPSCIALIGTAGGTTILSAMRALAHELDIKHSGMAHSEAALTLDHREALAMPILSSLVLLALFFMFKTIQYILLLMLGVGSVVAIAFVLQPLTDAAAAGRHRWLRQRTMLCNRIPTQVAHVVQGGVGLSVLLAWLLTGSMALNNVMGISLCMVFVSCVRLPSLKMGTMLLTALFFYDCFWVFFSQRLFGDNVMVAAATKQADNPAFMAAELLHVPSGLIAPQLELPIKLLFPQRLFSLSPQQPAVMLGLGDMALPGMLLALTLYFDAQGWWGQRGSFGYDLNSAASGNASPGGSDASLRLLLRWQFWRGSYTLVAWVGYVVGLVAAMGVGSVYQAAQPALLYLVPCTLLPLCAKARRRGELRQLWEGGEPPYLEGKEVDV